MIFDLESDGLLLNEVTKIHVLAYSGPNGVEYTHDYDEMRRVLLGAKVLIGHNIILYDIPVIEKILGIKIKAQLIDTLALSWYLNHKRRVHGLEAYGEKYGVPKPKITDWENLSPEEYAHRCVEDVKINKKLWKELKGKLLKLYDSKDDADRLIKYLTFKMLCVRMQEESKWLMDRQLVEKTLEDLLVQQESKISELKSVMPKVPEYVVRTRPAKPFKKDGTWSVTGARWFNLLREKNFPEDYRGEIKVLAREKDPNPNSHEQVKSWLFNLGWAPANFKYERNDDGTERSIPQVRVEGSDGKELCPSVKLLIDEYPAVGVLDGLTLLQHRISILEGFLKNANGSDELVAAVGGLTNTLRFKHRVLVNLPGVNKPLGDKIRGSLIAREGRVLCGSDMSSLEETTKKHYMHPFDPDFVEEMSKPGFDAHLDLAKHAKAVTQQEIDAYVEQIVGAKDLKPTRKIYKAANYACVYGVGAAKLARETGLTKAKATALIEAYWARNWAVKAACDRIQIKRIGSEMWLLNPVSKLWYSLRNEKDVFSTLNQGTGVFCFDSWVKEILEVRPQLTAQFHDEIVLEIKQGAEEKCRALLKKCISKVNDQLQLNTKLDVDVQFGQTYADIH